jgi:hypothetical protein
MAKNVNERFLTADQLREALIMYRQGALGAANANVSRSASSPSPGYRHGYPTAPPPPPPPASSEGFMSASQAANRRKSSRLDIIMLVLAVLAIIAVMGLIPLAVAVYRAYVPQPSNNLPESLQPLATGQVRVPDLVGLEEDIARRTLQDLGIELVIEGQEPHPTWPAFTVVSQSVPAGSGVDLGSSIAAVLSQGPSLIELPNVVGENFDQANQQLAQFDLVIQKYEDWSVEPPGQVVSQDPPPGSLIANRTLVTLVVSNGSRTPIGANLGGQIVAEAYEIPRLQFKPGEFISLTFFWRAITRPTEDYHLFVHLTTLEGGIVSQVDSPPQDGSIPTTQWGLNEIVVDPYQLSIPDSTAPGEYQIRIGFYNPDSNARLPILEAGRGEQDNLGALILRTIQIIP